MKKQLKKLTLTKKVVANFGTLFGGQLPRTQDRKACREDVPVETMGFCIPDTNTQF